MPLESDHFPHEIIDASPWFWPATKRPALKAWAADAAAPGIKTARRSAAAKVFAGRLLLGLGDQRTPGEKVSPPLPPAVELEVMAEADECAADWHREVSPERIEQQLSCWWRVTRPNPPWDE